MYCCQDCRMQVEDIRGHREIHHPEPPYDDGHTYTLTEAAVELRRQECRFRGHSWDVITTLRSEFPTGIVCGNCGLARRVTVDETVSSI